MRTSLLIPLAVAAALGQSRVLLHLTRPEISALRLSGDGRTVVFLAQRDTVLPTGAPLPRGLLAVPLEGGPPRLLVGVQQVAATLGTPVATLGGTGSSFYPGRVLARLPTATLPLSLPQPDAGQEPTR